MPDPKPSFSPGRRYRAAFNLMVGAFSLLVILVLVNYLAIQRLRARYDWSANDRFALSPLTLQVLAGLTNQVRVTVLYSRDAATFSYVDGLLRQYALVQPRIQLRIVDYNSDPNTAELLKATHKLGANAENLILFDNGVQPPRVVSEGELSTYDADIGGMMRGQEKEIRRAGFKGEMLFTSALAFLGESRPARACFLQGHGEHRRDGEDALFGYRRFAELIETKGVSLETLRLDGAQGIPPDCELVVIAGPEQPFTPQEAQKLGQFLDQGGRVLLLLHPYRPQLRLGLEDLLVNWGIATPPWYAGDEESSQSGHNTLVTSNLGSHPITSPLARREARLTFLRPRVVGGLPAEMLSPDAPRPEILVTTSTNGMTLSDLRENTIAFRPGVDRRGPIPIAVAAEMGSVSGVTLSRGAGRLVVIGDSTIFGNQVLSSYSNATFAELTVAWLLDRSQLLAIGPKPIDEYRIDLSERETRTLTWMLMGALPGSVLSLGFLVWFRRRS